jgi:hypothetical protein
MTDLQLYLAIGLPVLINTAALGLVVAHKNSRFDAINHRFDDMRDLWRAELHRVDEVLDARLKHLEQR